MNLNNAIADQTKFASKNRWQGWLFALGFTGVAFCVLGTGVAAQAASEKLSEKSYTMAPNAPERQTAQQAFAKTEGCMSCHTQTDQHTMHANPGVVLGCTDCHGGDATVKWNGTEQKQGTLAYDHTVPRVKKVSHRNTALRWTKRTLRRATRNSGTTLPRPTQNVRMPS